MKTDTLGILMDGRRQENLNTQAALLGFFTATVVSINDSQKKRTLTNLSGGVVLFEVEISLFQFVDTRFSQILQQQSVMKNEKFSQTLFRDPNFSFENIFDFYRICNGHIPGTCKLSLY